MLLFFKYLPHILLVGMLLGMCLGMWSSSFFSLLLFNTQDRIVREKIILSLNFWGGLYDDTALFLYKKEEEKKLRDRIFLKESKKTKFNIFDNKSLLESKKMFYN